MLTMDPHHAPRPRGPGGSFNSQIVLTPGRAALTGDRGPPDRGLDRVLHKSSGFGRHTAIIERREKIKQKTIETRRLHHRKYAA